MWAEKKRCHRPLLFLLSLSLSLPPSIFSLLVPSAPRGAWHHTIYKCHATFIFIVLYLCACTWVKECLCTDVRSLTIGVDHSVYYASPPYSHMVLDVWSITIHPRIDYTFHKPPISLSSRSSVCDSTSPADAGADVSSSTSSVPVRIFARLDACRE